MDIADWRRKIDEIDRKLVELVNERAHAAREIGRVKHAHEIPIYEPEREKEIFENICNLNRGPLQDRELIQIYERLIDVMRGLQRADMAGSRAPSTAGKSAERKADLND